jgi:hypothetical protein
MAKIPRPRGDSDSWPTNPPQGRVYRSRRTVGDQLNPGVPVSSPSSWKPILVGAMVLAVAVTLYLMTRAQTQPAPTPTNSPAVSATS